VALRQLRQLDERRLALEGLTADLRLARRDADAANQAKSAFLANMSHEIRTPFHGLLGMLSLLQKSGLTPRQVDHLRTATESANHLLAILDDILDVSQLESGRLTLSPVATDLRFIITVLKVNNDLERIDDLSETLAENAVFLSAQPPCDFPFDFKQMATLTRAMLKNALDSLVNLDLQRAQEVKASDDAVDDLNRAMYVQVQKEIRQTPERVEMYIHHIGISRSFERIADLATSIAEDVVYLVSGAIARH